MTRLCFDNGRDGRPYAFAAWSSLLPRAPPCAAASLAEPGQAHLLHLGGVATGICFGMSYAQHCHAGVYEVLGGVFPSWTLSLVVKHAPMFINLLVMRSIDKRAKEVTQCM